MKPACLGFAQTDFLLTKRCAWLWTWRQRIRRCELYFRFFLVSGIGFGWPQILVAGLPLVLDQICALLVGILRTWVHQVSPCNYQVFLLLQVFPWYQVCGGLGSFLKHLNFSCSRESLFCPSVTCTDRLVKQGQMKIGLLGPFQENFQLNHLYQDAGGFGGGRDFGSGGGGSKCYKCNRWEREMLFRNLKSLLCQVWPLCPWVQGGGGPLLQVPR